LLDGTGFTLLGFPPLQRLRNRGFGHRGPAMPATFRPRRFSRPRRFTPRNPCPGLFHPGNALGVSPSGFCSAPGIGTCLQALVLSCRSAPCPHSRSADRERAAPEPCSPRSVRTATVRKPAAAVTLLALVPLRLSPPPAWDRLLDPSSHALRLAAGASESCLPKA
jgi:hypothetical protein